MFRENTCKDKEIDGKGISKTEEKLEYLIRIFIDLMASFFSHFLFQ